MADILVKIDPKLYTKYVIKEKGRVILYAALVIPMYGTLRVLLFFWRNLTSIPVKNGYTVNTSDWFLATNMVEGRSVRFSGMPVT